MDLLKLKAMALASRRKKKDEEEEREEGEISDEEDAPQEKSAKVAREEGEAFLRSMFSTEALSESNTNSEPQSTTNLSQVSNEKESTQGEMPGLEGKKIEVENNLPADTSLDVEGSSLDLADDPFNPFPPAGSGYALDDLENENLTSPREKRCYYGADVEEQPDSADSPQKESLASKSSLDSEGDVEMEVSDEEGTGRSDARSTKAPSAATPVKFPQFSLSSSSDASSSRATTQSFASNGSVFTSFGTGRTQDWKGRSYSGDLRNTKSVSNRVIVSFETSDSEDESDSELKERHSKIQKEIEHLRQLISERTRGSKTTISSPADLIEQKMQDANDAENSDTSKSMHKGSRISPPVSKATLSKSSQQSAAQSVTKQVPRKRKVEEQTKTAGNLTGEHVEKNSAQGSSGGRVYADAVQMTKRTKRAKVAAATKQKPSLATSSTTTSDENAESSSIEQQETVAKESTQKGGHEEPLVQPSMVGTAKTGHSLPRTLDMRDKPTKQKPSLATSSSTTSDENAESSSIEQQETVAKESTQKGGHEEPLVQPSMVGTAKTGHSLPRTLDMREKVSNRAESSAIRVPSDTVQSSMDSLDPSSEGSVQRNRCLRSSPTSDSRLIRMSGQVTTREGYDSGKGAPSHEKLSSPPPVDSDSILKTKKHEGTTASSPTKESASIISQKAHSVVCGHPVPLEKKAPSIEGHSAYSASYGGERTAIQGIMEQKQKQQSQGAEEMVVQRIVKQKQKPRKKPYTQHEGLLTKEKYAEATGLQLDEARKQTVHHIAEEPLQVAHQSEVEHSENTSLSTSMDVDLSSQARNDVLRHAATAENTVTDASQEIAAVLQRCADHEEALAKMFINSSSLRRKLAEQEYQIAATLKERMHAMYDLLEAHQRRDAAMGPAVLPQLSLESSRRHSAISEGAVKMDRIPKERRTLKPRDALHFLFSSDSAFMLCSATSGVYWPTLIYRRPGNNTSKGAKKLEEHSTSVDDLVTALENRLQKKRKSQPKEEYRSPLLCFRSYVFSPNFERLGYPIRASPLGYSIDPMRPLCQFELSGRCNDDKCPQQHVSSLSLADLIDDACLRTEVTAKDSANLRRLLLAYRQFGDEKLAEAAFMYCRRRKNKRLRSFADCARHQSVANEQNRTDYTVSLFEGLTLSVCHMPKFWVANLFLMTLKDQHYDRYDSHVERLLGRDTSTINESEWISALEHDATLALQQGGLRHSIDELMRKQQLVLKRVCSSSALWSYTLATLLHFGNTEELMAMTCQARRTVPRCLLATFLEGQLFKKRVFTSTELLSLLQHDESEWHITFALLVLGCVRPSSGKLQDAVEQLNEFHESLLKMERPSANRTRLIVAITYLEVSLLFFDGLIGEQDGLYSLEGLLWRGIPKAPDLFVICLPQLFSVAGTDIADAHMCLCRERLLTCLKILDSVEGSDNALFPTRAVLLTNIAFFVDTFGDEVLRVTLENEWSRWVRLADATTCCLWLQQWGALGLRPPLPAGLQSNAAFQLGRAALSIVQEKPMTEYSFLNGCGFNPGDTEILLSFCTEMSSPSARSSLNADKVKSVLRVIESVEAAMIKRCMLWILAGLIQPENVAAKHLLASCEEMRDVSLCLPQGHGSFLSTFSQLPSYAPLAGETSAACDISRLLGAERQGMKFLTQEAIDIVSELNTSTAPSSGTHKALMVVRQLLLTEGRNNDEASLQGDLANLLKLDDTMDKLLS